MTMKKLIYLGPGDVFARLQAPEGFELVHVTTAEGLNDAITGCYGILDASMKFRITDAMVREAPALRVISTATTGSDHIDRGELGRRNVPVMTLKDDREFLRNVTPAAEHSWALLMACARRIPAALQHVREGNWNREMFPGLMLKGKQIGIIGCGRIGSWMGRYATAFGMRVVGYDPYLATLPPEIHATGLDDLLATSDFITLHIHLTEENKNFLSAERFRQIKQGAVIINTSRGAVLDERALLEGLVAGRIQAAGLDVLATEPEIGTNILVGYAREHDNLIITPHCGGFSPEAVLMVTQHALNKILQFRG